MNSVIGPLRSDEQPTSRYRPAVRTDRSPGKAKFAGGLIGSLLPGQTRAGRCARRQPGEHLLAMSEQ
jgi:hypothetical protein